MYKFMSIAYITIIMGFMVVYITAFVLNLIRAKKVNKEMKLVKWPEGKEVLKYTISTIIFCLVLCALFMLLNLILSVVKGWL